MSIDKVSEKKIKELTDTMTSLGILESDIEERFVLGSGKGGQKVNKSATKVQLKYNKYNLNIVCQKSRSRENNRFFARRLLCEKVEELLHGKQSKGQLKIEKIRKQKKRRKRRQTDS